MKKPISFLDGMLRYWPIVTSAVALVAGYAIMGSNANAAFKSTKDHEQRLTVLETRLEDLKEIRKDVKKLLERR